MSTTKRISILIIVVGLILPLVSLEGGLAGNALQR